MTRDPYGYAARSPLNNTDPTGLSSCGDWTDPGSYVDCASKAPDAAKDAGKTVLDVGLTTAATVPYGIYYLNYEAAHFVNSVGDRFGPVGSAISHIFALQFVPGQLIGLGGDAGIDWIKGHTVNNESVCDEGKRGYINPFHKWLPGPLKGPQVYLPGLHPNGGIDFEW